MHRKYSLLKETSKISMKKTSMNNPNRLPTSPLANLKTKNERTYYFLDTQWHDPTKNGYFPPFSSYQRAHQSPRRHPTPTFFT